MPELETVPVCERLHRVAELVQVDLAALTAHVEGRTVTADGRGSLEVALSNELYSRFHAGMTDTELKAVTFDRDWLFEEQLTAAVPHDTVVLEATLLPSDGLPGDDALVQMEGVRVAVPRDLVLGPAVGNGAGSPDGGAARPGDQVRLAVPSVRPAASPGFLFAFGTRRVPENPRRILRVYLSLDDPDVAPEVWGAALAELESRSVPYTAKVLSRRDSYPRTDAVVLYLQDVSIEDAHQVAASLSGLKGLAPTTSWFAEPLAPGVTAAQEPVDDRPRMRGLSFGQHRALLVARALVSSAGGEDLGAALVRELSEGGVQPGRPGLNVSEDSTEGSLSAEAST